MSWVWWRAPVVPATQEAEAGESLEPRRWRSEEHTSELQSPCNLVCRLLLEKKKKLIDRHSARSALDAELLTLNARCELRRAVGSRLARNSRAPPSRARRFNPTLFAICTSPD